MKTFIFTKEFISRSRTYGNTRSEIHIFRVKNNKPIKIGNIEVNSAATMGDIGEVNKFLHDNGFIPKSWNTEGRKSTTPYYEDRTEESRNKYQIIKLY